MRIAGLYQNIRSQRHQNLHRIHSSTFILHGDVHQVDARRAPDAVHLLPPRPTHLSRHHLDDDDGDDGPLLQIVVQGEEPTTDIYGLATPHQG